MNPVNGETIAVLLGAVFLAFIIYKVIRAIAAFVEGLGGPTNPRDDEPED